MHADKHAGMCTDVLKGMCMDMRLAACHRDQHAEPDRAVFAQQSRCGSTIRAVTARPPPPPACTSACKCVRARMCRWAGRWQQQSNDTGLALASQERYAQPPRLVTVVCTVVCRNDCRRTWARCTVSSLRHCAASSPMPAFPKGLASAHTHA